MEILAVLALLLGSYAIILTNLYLEQARALKRLKTQIQANKSSKKSNRADAIDKELYFLTPEQRQAVRDGKSSIKIK